MFSVAELNAIELILLTQISELKERLKFYKACRMYDRLKSCQCSLNYFEELRNKVAELKESNEQIKLELNCRSTSCGLK